MDEEEAASRIFEEARKRFLHWIKIASFPVLVISGFLGYLGIDALIGRAVDQGIKDRSLFISQSFGEVASAVAQETIEMLADSEVRIRNLNSQVEKIQKSRDLADGSISQLNVMMQRVENFTKERNVAKVLSFLEAEYFTINDISLSVGVCYNNADSRDELYSLIVANPQVDLIISEAIEKRYGLGDLSAEPLEIEFAPDHYTGTMLTFNNNSCYQYESTLFAPYKVLVYGASAREFPSIIGLELSSYGSSAYNDVSLEGLTGEEVFHAVFQEISRIYVTVRVNGVEIKLFDDAVKSTSFETLLREGGHPNFIFRPNLPEAVRLEDALEERINENL